MVNRFNDRTQIGSYQRLKPRGACCWLAWHSCSSWWDRVKKDWLAQCQCNVTGWGVWYLWHYTLLVSQWPWFWREQRLTRCLTINRTWSQLHTIHLHESYKTWIWTKVVGFSCSLRALLSWQHTLFTRICYRILGPLKPKCKNMI